MKTAQEFLECRTCHGSGEIVGGWTWGTRLSPPDPIDVECPICLGHRRVKPWELEEFGGVFPSETEAAEIFHERARMLEEMSWERRVDAAMEGEPG